MGKVKKVFDVLPLLGKPNSDYLYEHGNALLEVTTFRINVTNIPLTDTIRKTVKAIGAEIVEQKGKGTWGIKYLKNTPRETILAFLKVVEYLSQETDYTDVDYTTMDDLNDDIPTEEYIDDLEKQEETDRIEAEIDAEFEAEESDLPPIDIDSLPDADLSGLIGKLEKLEVKHKKKVA